MKIPKYEEIRKPAGHGYRPALAMRDKVTQALAAIKFNAAVPVVVECFDTMIQERVAVIALDIDGDILPFAIMHNGNLTERLVPCCGVEDVKGEEATTNGLTPEEWDLLPCFEAMEGN